MKKGAPMGAPFSVWATDNRPQAVTPLATSAYSSIWSKFM